MSSYLAHSPDEPLAAHLRGVSSRAAEFAAAFDASEAARVAGLFHDFGKYGAFFQRRVRGERLRIDHSYSGAAETLRRYGATGVLPALAVQGHHGGLQIAANKELRGLMSWRSGDPVADGRLRPEEPSEELMRRLEQDGLSAPEALIGGELQLSAGNAAAMLDVRMLYSALVDADFLATEEYKEAASNKSPSRPVGVTMNPGTALAALLKHIESIAADSEGSAKVAEMRADLRDACVHRAVEATGLFTLTAPTGAGKTLSMLAFALRHAQRHRLRRVVAVIPYLSIIEQTVGVYRNALEGVWPGEDLQRCVLEDHSLAGVRPTPTNGAQVSNQEEEADAARGLLAENWDAPLVVTTSVQFLESLFANRPAPCRKLHRLARSVILLDEVQTLPARLAVPTLATLARLAERYGATVVFSTATQPAFAHLDGAVRKFCASGWEPREIVPEGLQLFERARRTQVRWPRSGEPPTTWSDLATELAAEPQALCIVNLKRHAWALLDALEADRPDDLFHLSTSMCPAHRRGVLGKVRQRLKAGERCRLISTQCVEAGVDVDFPVVYRAWAPLEAIAQAAGRCNREGRREVGEVRVFRPEAQLGRLYPDSAYEQAAQVTDTLLRQRGPEDLDLSMPALFDQYYARLYTLQDPKGYDYHTTRDELIRAIYERDFPEVAQNYRLITQDAINVLVPYDPKAFAALAREVRQTGLTYEWILRARAHAVGLFRPRAEQFVITHLEPARLPRNQGDSEDWFVYLTSDHYDERRGLMPPQADSVQIA